LIVSGGDRHSTEAFAKSLAAAAPFMTEVQVLGPAEAPLAVVRGRHRFRLLVKSSRAFDLSGYLRQWLSGAPKPKGKLALEIDVDPQSFL
jgi:primosomal protein N' (replication factor Y)